ncbi:MAG TPA: cytochrome c [Polyangiaceae bacterium]|jgi:mono/diheme cytochrome c family protein
MRTFILFGVSGFIMLAACWTNGPPTPSSADTDGGKALADSLACASCHGADLAGSETPIGAGGALAYPPNLTPDPDTGLGSWSDDQIATAVTTGVDDEGATLCNAMPRFSSLGADDLAALVAYLRSLPAIAHDVPESDCAEEDLDDAGRDDAGVVIVTDDAPSCEGYADPTTASVCHACSGATCQPNGCFGGWFCELASARCVPQPSGC